jgi:YD repeat-containing protein
MKLAGDYSFAAPQTVVWHALLDPTVLASVLPGCERLELVGDHVYEGQLQIKIGPVQGSFLGKVTLQDLQPESSYSMIVDGSGAPGFVKATARLTLAPDGQTTRLRYDADAQVGGKIASVGQRLVESSAKAIIKQSLEGLNAAMIARAAASTPQSPPSASVSSSTIPTAEPVLPPESIPRPVLPAAPSATSFAANVAKEVAKDLIPPVARRVIIVVLLVLLAVIVYRVVF